LERSRIGQVKLGAWSALFKQTDPDVASFDSGYGSALLARQVGQKRAR
jgi:1,4-dihydroxy-2-naphthoyl-CoA synthase